MRGESFSELLDQIDPEDLLSYLGIEYRKTTGSKGPQLNVRQCPRCGGTKWKVFLNAETGLGNCFHGACVGGPGFNKFTFVEHLLGSKREAVQTLKAYGREIGWRPKPRRSVQVSVGVKNDGLRLPDSMPLPYKGQIGSYLSGRGFTPETVRYFGWRYCQQGHFDYIGTDGQPRQQRYDRRIVIPVYDLDGNLVTFQGRDVTGQAQRRYLFPPGLPSTARFLYNAHEALGKPELVLGEGAFDVAAIYQALSEDKTLSVGVAGTFGKNLSMGGGEDQLAQLIRLKEAGLQTVTFMWDGESSAIRQACEQALKLKGYGFRVRVAILPAGKDPNEISAYEVRRAYYRAFEVSRLSVARCLSMLSLVR